MLQDQWKYDPFSAHKEENGDIYARGSQVRSYHSLLWYAIGLQQHKNKHFELLPEVCFSRETGVVMKISIRDAFQLCNSC